MALGSSENCKTACEAGTAVVDSRTIAGFRLWLRAAASKIAQG